MVIRLMAIAKILDKWGRAIGVGLAATTTQDYDNILNRPFFYSSSEVSYMRWRRHNC